MKSVNLKEAEEKPLFEIVLWDGEKKLNIDPFEVAGKLEGFPIAERGSLQFFDAVRQAFGFPSQADAKEKNERTLAARECVLLAEGINDFMAEVDAKKKAQPDNPNSGDTSTLTAPTSPK